MSARERLIPADVILKFIEGSYETLIERVQTLVESEAARIFGTDTVAVRVQGTYARHAIIVSDSEQFPMVRVHFEATAAGDLKLVKHEVIPVKSYDAASLPDFIHQESRRVVEQLLAGNGEDAVMRAAKLMPLVTDHAPVDETRVLDQVREHVNASRAWKRALEAQPQAVTKFLGEALVTLDKGRLTPKFGKLYDGSVSAGDLPGYRGLVVEDSEALQGRVDALGAAVGRASQLVSAKAEVVGTKGGADSVASFEALAKDLGADLVELSRLTRRSTRVLAQVDGLARNYDIVAESLYHYEVASLFVTKLAQRISQVAG